MTERELYVSCIPMIAEIITMCRRISRQDYEKWKQETMESAPETVKGFIGKVFVVIEHVLGGADG